MNVKDIEAEIKAKKEEYDSMVKELETQKTAISEMWANHAKELGPIGKEIGVLDEFVDVANDLKGQLKGANLAVANQRSKIMDLVKNVDDATGIGLVFPEIGDILESNTKSNGLQAEVADVVASGEHTRKEVMLIVADKYGRNSGAVSRVIKDNFKVDDTTGIVSI